MPAILLRQQGDVIPAEEKEGITIHAVTEAGMQSIVLRKDVVTIGRGTGSDIKTTVSSVSRQHCTLVRREDGWYITDHKSKSGTFIYRSTRHGGTFLVQLISGEFPLKFGDHISLGGPKDATPVLVFNFASS